MDLNLNDKVAIVTGGSDGIGKAAAISLAKEGAKVAIIARNQEKIDLAVKEISETTNGNIIGISTDVSDESEVKTMVSRVADEFGRIDILINNAGTSLFEKIW